MFCPKCGQELNDDAAFCFSCGNRLQESELLCPQKKKSKVSHLIIIICALTFTVAALLAYILLDRSPNRDFEEPVTVTDQILVETQPQETTAEISTEEASEATDETQTTEQTGSGETEAPTENTEPEETTPRTENPQTVAQTAVTGTDTVGIPLPSLSEDTRREILKIYSDLLTAEPDAVSYSLLDMLGDDVPELIIRCSGEKAGYYRIYFVLNNHPLLVQGELLAEDCDVLRGYNRKLLLCRQNGSATVAGISQTLSIVSETVADSSEITYTDTVLTDTADSAGLLKLALLGNSEKTSYSGWVRFNGRDYFYADKKPVSKKWCEENGRLYYLGDSGYVQYTADQEMLESVMYEYWTGFMEAINQQDVAYLINATDAQKQNVKKMLDGKIYKYRTLSQFVCETKIKDHSDSTGTILLTTNVRWLSSVTWDGVKTDIMDREQAVTLVNQDGKWLVDNTRYL